MMSTNPNETWNDSRTSEVSSIVEMVRINTDRSTTTLNANATVAYPVHATLSNFLNEYRRYPIDHGHTFIGLLPVPTARQDHHASIDETLERKSVFDVSPVVPLLDELHQTSLKMEET